MTRAVFFYRLFSVETLLAVTLATDMGQEHTEGLGPLTSIFFLFESSHGSLCDLKRRSRVAPEVDDETWSRPAELFLPRNRKWRISNAKEELVLLCCRRQGENPCRACRKDQHLKMVSKVLEFYFGSIKALSGYLWNTKRKPWVSFWYHFIHNAFPSKRDIVCNVKYLQVRCSFGHNLRILKLVHHNIELEHDQDHNYYEEDAVKQSAKRWNAGIHVFSFCECVGFWVLSWVNS